jgi:hypothetical protein
MYCHGRLGGGGRYRLIVRQRWELYSNGHQIGLQGEENEDGIL